MALNLAAIFGVDTSAIAPPVLVPPVDDPAEVQVNLAYEQVEVQVAAIPAPWPIIPGTEHFSIWVDDPDGRWPEFIPGHHYDIRQPSRLRPLCSPRNENED